MRQLYWYLNNQMLILKAGISLCVFQLVVFLILMATGYQWFTVSFDPYRVAVVVCYYVFFILSGLAAIKYNRVILTSSSQNAFMSRVGLHPLFWLALIFKMFFLVRLCLYILSNPNTLLRSIWFDNTAALSVYGSHILAWLDRSFITIFILLAFAVSLSQRSLIQKIFFGSIILIESILSAGRFSIYFVALLLAAKASRSVKKNSYVVLLTVLFLSALIITGSRSGQKLDFIDTVIPSITNIFEYHILPPFYLYETLGNQAIIELPYSFGSGAFSWLLLLLRGIVLNTADLPYFTVSEIISDPILHSEISNNYFNAFATAFIIPYVDFGVLGAAFNGLYFFVIYTISVRLIPKGSLTVAISEFLGAIYFMSLFVPYLYSPGLGWVLLLTIFMYGIVVQRRAQIYERFN